jgi:hypothetical protein
MGSIFNRWSFYLSFLCIAQCLLFSFNSIKDRFLMWIGIHPFEFLFYFTLGVFFFGMFGFAGITNWKSALRSIFTVGFTLVLTVFLTYIIYVGHLVE